MMRDVALGGLTRRQLQAYRFIESYIREHGCSPSFDEIRGGLGMKSKAPVHNMVKRMVERGFVTTLPGRSRSIALTARAA